MISLWSPNLPSLRSRKKRAPIRRNGHRNASAARFRHANGLPTLHYSNDACVFSASCARSRAPHPPPSPAPLQLKKRRARNGEKREKTGEGLVPRPPKMRRSSGSTHLRSTSRLSPSLNQRKCMIQLQLGRASQARGLGSPLFWAPHAHHLGLVLGRATRTWGSPEL